MGVVGAVEGHVPAVDKPTFERIVQDHGSFVRRTLAHLGVVARHLADVEQEVLRGVHRGLSAFDPTLAANPEKAVRAWLFGICARQAASHRRAETRRAEVLLATEDLDGERDERPDSEDAYVAAERRALLFELLATLEPRRRAVIIAYELEGMEMAEVAEAIGIPVNTCWNRLRLARADLRAAWTRMSAQHAFSTEGAANRAGTPSVPSPERRRSENAAWVPFAFLAPGSAGWEAAPLGKLEWLFRSARDWLSRAVGERLSPGRSLSLGRAVVPVKVALVAVPGLGLLAAAAALALTSPMSPTSRRAAANGAEAPESPPPSAEAEIVPERASGASPTSAAALAVESVPPAASTVGVGVESVPPAASAVAAAGVGVAPSVGGAQREVPSLEVAVSSRRPVRAAPLPAGGGVNASRRTGISRDVVLQEETSTLAGAKTAYQNGDAALAKRLLDRYERTFPNGRMRATSILLRLRLLMSQGCRNEARDTARRWLTDHPRSDDRAAIVQIVGPLD